MLEISISSNFQKEKEYIISTLLNDFLSLEYKLIVYDNQQDYFIKFDNKTIIIKDDFFNKITSKIYLEKKKIPEKISFNSENTPIIFGDNSFQKTDNEISIGLDIFASSFFMLTRWEELFLEKDEHGRTKSSQQLSVKNNFHRRPIVNEYVELLWSLLLEIGYSESNRRKIAFEYRFSHDVDHPQLFTNFRGFIKQSAFQFLKKGNVGQSINFTKNYLSNSKDPYDTFDLLMDLSEQKGNKSQFNFMCCSKNRFEEGYDLNSKFNQELISRIKNRNHKIGFHPSYNTFQDSDLWKYEKQCLENAIDIEIDSGRQHYLRFENKTWNIWEENNMVKDSTLGFADEVGFRAGTCYPFHPFDIFNRKKLNLIETPLVVMEGALIHHLKVTPEKFIDVSNNLKTLIQKYNGVYSILWHNSSFFLEEYKPYEKIILESAL